jgi:hypothetical protein
MNKDEQQEITDAIEGLSIDLDTAKNLRDTQVDRTSQDQNTLQIFNQDGVKNPLEDDIDANRQNILNINGLAATELSSDIAKFNSLTVGGVAVTGSGGVQIKNDGTALNPNANIINFIGDGVSSSASSGEATINIGASKGLPTLVVTKGGTQLTQVNVGTQITHLGNPWITDWGNISLLPAIGTKDLNQGAGVTDVFVFNRAVTVYMVHLDAWGTTGAGAHGVDVSKWWVHSKSTGTAHSYPSHQEHWAQYSPHANPTTLYWKIFPAGTFTLDDSSCTYFFKPFPS